MIIGKGLRQNWLANECGVDSSVFTKWITGERDCPEATKPILAKLLGCSVEDIFKGKKTK